MKIALFFIFVSSSVFAQSILLNKDTIYLFRINTSYTCGGGIFEPIVDRVTFNTSTYFYQLHGHISGFESDTSAANNVSIDKISGINRINDYSIIQNGKFVVEMRKNDTLFFRFGRYEEGDYYKYAVIKKPRKKLKINPTHIKITTDTLWSLSKKFFDKNFYESDTADLLNIYVDSVIHNSMKKDFTLYGGFVYGRKDSGDVSFDMIRNGKIIKDYALTNSVGNFKIRILLNDTLGMHVKNYKNGDRYDYIGIRKRHP